MMNFREICKTIFFCIVSINLGVSSGSFPSIWAFQVDLKFLALFLQPCLSRFTSSNICFQSLRWVKEKSRATEKFSHTVQLFRVHCGGYSRRASKWASRRTWSLSRHGIYFTWHGCKSGVSGMAATKSLSCSMALPHFSWGYSKRLVQASSVPLWRYCLRYMRLAVRTLLFTSGCFSFYFMRVCAAHRISVLNIGRAIVITVAAGPKNITSRIA